MSEFREPTQEEVAQIMDDMGAMAHRWVVLQGVPPRAYLDILAAHAVFGICNAPVVLHQMLLDGFVERVRESYRRVCE